MSHCIDTNEKWIALGKNCAGPGGSWLYTLPYLTCPFTISCHKNRCFFPMYNACKIYLGINDFFWRSLDFLDPSPGDLANRCKSMRWAFYLKINKNKSIYFQLIIPWERENIIEVKDIIKNFVKVKNTNIVEKENWGCVIEWWLSILAKIN